MRTATVHRLSVPAKLRCEGCGTLADAACDCGVSYVPVKPAVAAAKAVAANPHKSDRAIAAEIGVDHKTVSKARRGSGGENSPPKREGRNGVMQVAAKPRRVAKVRKAPPSLHQYTEADIDEDITADDIEVANAANRRRHFLRCVSLSASQGEYGAGLREAKANEIDGEVRSGLKSVVDAWTDLQTEMLKRAAKKGPPVLPKEVNAQTSKLGFVFEVCASMQGWLAENDRREISQESRDSLILFLHKAADELLMVAQKLDGR